MHVRLPWQKIDTFLLSLVPHVKVLEYRNYSVEDVTFDVMALKLKQQAIDKFFKRLTKKVDQTGAKAIDLVSVEQSLLNQIERSNEAKVDEQKKLDKVAYSLIELYFYEDVKISKQTVVNTKIDKTYYVKYGNRLLNAFRKGWYMLLDFVVFIVNIWVIILLLLILAYITWRYWRSRKIKKNNIIC